VDVYVSHAWSDRAPYAKAAALKSFLLLQNLGATVLVMSLMLGMAVSPFGFMLTDITSSRYDDDTAVVDATSAGSSSSSGSWGAPATVENATESIEGLDHTGIGWWVLPSSVFTLGVAFVLWAVMSGGLPCIPSSWGPWKLAETKIWVDKCCECLLGLLLLPCLAL
jgi:hypothetical protein